MDKCSDQCDYPPIWRFAVQKYSPGLLGQWQENQVPKPVVRHGNYPGNNVCFALVILEEERIIGYRIKLDIYDVLRVADRRMDGAMNLRNTAQGVRILNISRVIWPAEMCAIEQST